jgi:hypothetical protein
LQLLDFAIEKKSNETADSEEQIMRWIAQVGILIMQVFPLNLPN